MILDVKRGARGVLVNADTGERIAFARWADTDTGEYEAFRTLDGKNIFRDDRGRPVLYRGRARLRFVPSQAPPLLPRPSDPRDLARSLAEARRAHPLVVSSGRECDEPGCHALAEWESASERVIEPEVGNDGHSYERGVVTRLKRWCPRHYRPGTTVSLRGVESEIDVGRARPQ